MTYEQWIRWRACTRKRPMTRLEANTTTLAAWSRGDGAMRAYECEWCQQWHVGHWNGSENG